MPDPTAPTSSRLHRVAAGALALIPFVAMALQLGRRDVFVEQHGSCPPGTLTLIPFLAALGIGAFATRFAIYGPSLGYPPPRLPWRQRAPGARRRDVIWWTLLSVGLAGSASILWNNLTIAVLVGTAAAVGKLIVGFAAIVLGGIGLVWLASIPHRRRLSGVERDLQRMPAHAIDSALRSIEAVASRAEWCVLHRELADGPLDGPDSHVGGTPSVAPGEEWPTSPGGEPGLFLLRITLSAPRLGAPWAGRLLDAFLVDGELVVRSHPAGLARGDEAARPPVGARRLPERRLRPLRIPYAPDAEAEDPGYSSVVLLERVPGLEAQLARHSRHPRILLARLLAPARSRVELDASDVIVEGADPDLIQGPHEAVCAECGGPMRFLLQFGDVTGPEFLFGDAGVAYVYGCDLHPSRCVGFVDFT